MIATNRSRRQILKTRTRAQRAAAKIRREGVATLATHCLAAGLPIREARTVAGSLRRNAYAAGINGIDSRTHAGRHMRYCQRYTPAQVAVIALRYKPRKPAYRTAAARLALAA